MMNDDGVRVAGQVRIPHSGVRNQGAGEGAGACEAVAWLEEAARLNAGGTPFVLATVVAREAPQSVRSGSKALIHPDGRLDGWVGGGCVRPTVIREARAALADGRPRLVRINPTAAEDAREDVRVYAMTCQGEGAVDVYLEPVLPRVDLVVLGRTPVAEALARLALPLEMRVRLADPRLDPRGFAGAEVLGDYARVPDVAGARSYVVVATMGEGDEDALRAAVASDARYVGLVASRKKAASLLEFLRAEGVAEARLARVKAPAGLDFGAVTPAEIALSVLAEVVQRQRSAGHASHLPSPAEAEAPATAPPGAALPIATDVQLAATAGTAAAASASAASRVEATAIDPVCGMAVEPATARHSHEHDGRTYYFCCPHCKAAFVKDPARYLATANG